MRIQREEVAKAFPRLASVTYVRWPDLLVDLWWKRLASPLPQMSFGAWRGIDVFLATCYVVPVLRHCRVVSFVYDLTPLRLPTLAAQPGFEDRVKDAVARSHLVIVTSKKTKADVAELLEVDPRRIKVIYPTLDRLYRPLREFDACSTLRRYRIENPFILYVGGLAPYKNVKTLLRAYEQSKRRLPSNLKLVLVGRTEWGPELLDRIRQSPVRRDVILPGFVPDGDLPAFYTTARMFVYPSLYEGFALPVLEAMACGTPVIASNRASLPEVIDHAGILIDPFDVPTMSKAMERLCGSPQLRKELRQAGLARAGEFRGDQSRLKLLKTMQMLA